MVDVLSMVMQMMQQDEGEAEVFMAGPVPAKYREAYKEWRSYLGGEFKQIADLLDELERQVAESEGDESEGESRVH